MADTKIEWCDKVWNPVAGCSIVSPGCKSCYAMRMAARLEAMGQKQYAGTTKKVKGKAIWTGKINLVESALALPMKWRKPKKIFVNSMSDLFHADVPFEYVDLVFSVMLFCDQHVFQVLTKRPERMAEYLASRGHRRDTIFAPPDKDVALAQWVDMIAKRPWPLKNVWLGTSVENQKCAAERIPHLIECPASVRFLSCEPLLGEIDLSEWVPCAQRDFGHDSVGLGIHWVIVGGESGPGSRPFDVLWAESIVEQCRDAGVACFVKQLGSAPMIGDLTDAQAASESLGFSLDDGPLDWGTGKFNLRDKKGGDMSEWPKHLCVREFPKAMAEVAP